MEETTIAAISTAMSASGIGIVRISVENPPIGKEAYNNELTKQSEIVVKRLKYIKPGEKIGRASCRERV